MGSRFRNATDECLAKIRVASDCFVERNRKRHRFSDCLAAPAGGAFARLTPQVAPNPSEVDPMSLKYETMNPLPQETRDKMVALLNGIMADILDNHYQSLLAHWNARGSNFIALHEFFDRYAGCNGADNWCDWVAERISQLGGTVNTTVQFIAANTSLKEYPMTITRGEDHVHALATSARTIIVRLRGAIAEALALQDNVTASILADVQRSAEQFLWLLEAHVVQPLRSPEPLA